MTETVATIITDGTLRGAAKTEHIINMTEREYSTESGIFYCG
jgi:hypothetical protein